MRGSASNTGRLGNTEGAWIPGRRETLNYIRAADSDPSWEANVPKFAAEIRQIFTDEELQAYFGTATRIGVTGHVCTEEQYETMRDAGAFDENAVTGVRNRAAAGVAQTKIERISLSVCVKGLLVETICIGPEQGHAVQPHSAANVIRVFHVRRMTSSPLTVIS
jgi:hypothetical protein